MAEFSPPDAHGKHNQFASTATGSDFKFRSVLYDVVNSGVNTFTAVFRLNEIRCEDEGNYRCVVGFSTSSGSYTKSSNVSLMVTGKQLFWGFMQGRRFHHLFYLFFFKDIYDV